MSNYLSIDKVVKSVSITHKFDKPILSFLNTSDVENGKVINVNKLPIEELKGQAKKTIKKDDILFSEIRPKNRRFAYIDFADTYDYVVSTKLMVLRNINPNVDNRYFYYFLTNDFMLSILQDRAENRIGSFPQITFDILSEYDIRVPDLDEQRRIASILYAIDSKIALNNRINAELEAMAKTVYDYWFVQFDFPNAEGKPYKSSGGKMVWCEELKREVPEGWEVGELSDLAISIIRGISPKYIEDSGICVLNQKCIRDNIINFEPSRRHNNKLKDASARFIKPGDILVNSTGFGTLGRVAFVKWLQEESTTVDSHVTIVRPNEKIINSEYLAYSVQYKQAEIENMAEGSTGQTELSRVKLGSLKVIIPSDELQQNFAAIVKPQIQKIANNQQENQQLSSLRDWLLPMLMNGQVRVQPLAPEGEQEVERLMAAEPRVGYGV